MFVNNRIKCVVKLIFDGFPVCDIICDFIDIGKCIRSLPDNFGFKDDDFKKMTIIVSFKSCFR